MNGGRRLSIDILTVKSSAVAVAFLFLSSAVASPISSTFAKASTDTGMVEVRVEPCGLRGVEGSTVRLTRQQYQTMEQYFSKFQEQFSQTTTRAEAVPLFRDAVVELNSYGLVPKNLGVEQAQRLVTGYQDFTEGSPLENTVQSLWTKGNHQFLNPNLKNAFCLLFATATKIPGYPSTPVIVPLGLLLVLALIPSFIVSVLGAKELANRLAEAGLRLWMLNPFRIFNFVLLTGYDILLLSLGLKGLVMESFSGEGFFMGFTGFMLTLGSEKSIFLGFAFSVNGLR